MNLKLMKLPTAKSGIIYRIGVITIWLALFVACNNEKTEKSDNADSLQKNEAPQRSVGETAIPVYDTAIVTVANIVIDASKTAQVVFDQREAFYSLLSTNKNYSTILKSLQESQAKQSSIRAVIENKTYTIQNVLTLSTAVLDSLSKAAKNNVSATVTTLPDKWDSSIINRTMIKGRLGCTSPVSLTTATAIFNTCAQQSCTLIGPPTPCIPFQYVRDGCYARAHKMAAIIASYGYCVSKVFSFANKGTDQLAVKAALWGNCCVTWWYHVAPVLLVSTTSGNVYYVIDPGMATGPITLATWLGAQANTACTPRAKVSSYVITDPNYYTPANYAGTLFNTDPYYINTNNTLAYYRYFTTCP
jgi:hypothetical protein